MSPSEIPNSSTPGAPSDTASFVADTTRLTRRRPFVRGRATYSGSCLCGAWRFEVTLDLSEGTTRCNCSHCHKHGWWGLSVPPSDFRVVAVPEEVRERIDAPIGEYEVQRLHCATCGINSFGRGHVAELGGAFVSVNVRCLDHVELSGVPVRFLDGLHDTWAQVKEGAYDDPFAERIARSA